MWEWWVLSCAVGLATWAYLTGKIWRSLGTSGSAPRARVALIALAQVLVSVIVLTGGFLLEPAIAAAMDPESGGMRPPGGGEILVAIFSGLVPACVVAMAAREGQDRGARLRNACAASVIMLLLLDNVWNILARRPVEQFLFSLFSDVLGGALAGLVVGFALEEIRTRWEAPAAREGARRGR